MFTNEQLLLIKNTIAGDPVLSAYPMDLDGSWEIAILLNAPSSPEVIVWKTYVEAEEIMSNGFIWTAVDSLTAGKARIWDWMTRYGSINPSKPNVRQGLADCFGAGSAMATAILPHMKRVASRVEALFVTGGAGTTASPSTLVFEGTITYSEVHRARLM